MSHYDLLFKLVLAGEAGVGKTSLLRRYCDDTFQEQYQSTIGVDFKVKTLRLEEKQLKLQIWDTAGQERFASLSAAYFRGAHGVCVVYDLTQRASFERVSHWVDQVRQRAAEDVEVLILGNKCDLEAVVTEEEAEELARSLQARQLRCSALDGENVSEALRQLAERLLRRRAVYGPPAQVYGPPLAAPGPRCCVLGPEGFVGERDREAMALRARDLEALPSCCPHSLATALLSRTPARFRAAAGAWKVRTPELERFGDVQVPVSKLTGGVSCPPFRAERMALRDFLSRLRRQDSSRRDWYLQQLPVRQYLPELAPELLADGPRGLEGLSVICTFFCGAKDVRTSLHYDRTDPQGHASVDNIFLQLSGRKRFRLYRPSDHDCLYARGDKEAPHVSQVDTRHVDQARFPLYARALARSFEVVLEPGDALLVPRWWWHESFSLSDGMAVNWWFEQGQSCRAGKEGQDPEVS